MGSFYVKRNGKLFGPLTESQINNCLNKEIFSSEDLFSLDHLNWHKLEDFIFADHPDLLPDVPQLDQLPPPTIFDSNTLPAVTPPLPGTKPPSAPAPVSAIPKSASRQPFIAFWRNFGVLHGRASRSEYWMPLLLNLFIFAVLSAAIHTIYESDYLSLYPLALTLFVFGVTYCLATIIPSWTVTVRRLHDLNYSGWLLLTTLIPVLGPFFILCFHLLFCFKGTKGENKYGPESA